METPKTIYTVKGKKLNFVWEFHYDLEGFLTEFKILEGRMHETQKTWLFHQVNFPYEQKDIEQWKSIKLIEIIVGQPDLSFEVFYNTYDYKVKRVTAERAWNRLTKADKISAIAGVKKYDGFLKRKQTQSKAYPATYLNQRYWEDSYGSI